MCENGASGRVGACCSERGDACACRPADCSTGGGHHGHLGGRDERELPTARAVPRQAPPFRLGVATEPGRGEDGERQQQGRRFAADQQQPAPRDRPGPFGGTQLVDRRDQVVRERLRLHTRTLALDLFGEPVECPRMDVVRTQRNGPHVAAVRGPEYGRPRQPADTLGEEKRRRGGGVVPE